MLAAAARAAPASSTRSARADVDAVLAQQRELRGPAGVTLAQQLAGPVSPGLVGNRPSGLPPARPCLVIEQVAERAQARAQAFQHRHAAGAQQQRRVLVDRAWQIAEYDDRLAGQARGVEHGQLIGRVAVQLGDQVDGERDRVDGLVVRERGQRAGEQLAGARASAPDVERVRGEQAGVEQRLEPGLGGVAELRERHADLVGEIGGVGAFKPRVMHRRDAAAGRVLAVRGWNARGTGAAGGAEGEQFERVGQFAQVADPVDSVAANQRLPAAVRAGQRTRVGGDHGPAADRVARGQQHDRYVALRGLGERPLQLGWLAHRLQDQRDDLGLRQAERVGQVRSRGCHEFLARGDREREAEGAA